MNGVLFIFLTFTILMDSESRSEPICNPGEQLRFHCKTCAWGMNIELFTRTLKPRDENIQNTSSTLKHTNSAYVSSSNDYSDSTPSKKVCRPDTVLDNSKNGSTYTHGNMTVHTMFGTEMTQNSYAYRVYNFSATVIPIASAHALMMLLVLVAS